MIYKAINILEDCIGCGEKLDEVADSVANTGCDDTENHERSEEPKRSYKPDRVHIGHVNAGSYESTENYEL